MRKPRSVATLTELGRVRLSNSFFMRDMLHSEIAQVHGLLNAPDDPDLAIEAGKRLCEEMLEPLQVEFGRFRSDPPIAVGRLTRSGMPKDTIAPQMREMRPNIFGTCATRTDAWAQWPAGHSVIL